MCARESAIGIGFHAEDSCDTAGEWAGGVAWLGLAEWVGLANRGGSRLDQVGHDSGA